MGVANITAKFTGVYRDSPHPEELPELIPTYDTQFYLFTGS